MLTASGGEATRGAAEESGKVSSVRCAKGETKVQKRDRANYHTTEGRAGIRTVTFSQYFF